MLPFGDGPFREGEKTARAALKKLERLQEALDHRASYELLWWERNGIALVDVITSSLKAFAVELKEEFGSLETEADKAEGEGYTIALAVVEQRVKEKEAEKGQQARRRADLGLCRYSWPDGDYLFFEQHPVVTLLWRDSTAEAKAGRRKDELERLGPGSAELSARETLSRAHKELAGPRLWDQMKATVPIVAGAQSWCCLCLKNIEGKAYHRFTDSGLSLWAHESCLDGELEASKGTDNKEASSAIESLRQCSPYKARKNQKGQFICVFCRRAIEAGQMARRAKNKRAHESCVQERLYPW